MRFLSIISVLCLAGIGGVHAQTTGLAPFNDLSWDSGCFGVQGAGGTSCSPSTICCGLSTGGFLRFETSSPFSPAYLLLSGACVPNSPCLPSASYPIPKTACSGSENQSIDLAAITILPAGITDADGVLWVPVPPLSLAWLDVQAVAFDPFASTPLNIVVSQALHLNP